jgi:hypothetical protein
MTEIKYTILYCVPIPVPLRSANKLRFRFRYGKKLGFLRFRFWIRIQESKKHRIPGPASGSANTVYNKWRKAKKLQIPIGLCRPNIMCEIQCCGSGSVGSVCFGALDPDPLVRGMDPVSAPDPDPSIIKQKKYEKNLDSYCFVTSFLFFFLIPCRIRN